MTRANPAEALENFGNFLYPTLPVSFEADTKSHLYGVYARESERSHTGGKCVTCRGLHIQCNNLVNNDADQKECKGKKVKEVIILNWENIIPFRTNNLHESLALPLLSFPIHTSQVPHCFLY